MNRICTNTCGNPLPESATAPQTFSFKSINKRFFLLPLMAILFVLSGQEAKAQNGSTFNDGYIVAFRDSSNVTLAASGTNIIVEEYVPTTTGQTSATLPNFKFKVPASASTLGATDLVVAGSSTTAGLMSRSENGRYLLLPGYKALIGAATSTMNTNSAVRTLSGSATYGAGVQGNGTTGFFSGGNNIFRGATSDDGTNYWATGTLAGSGIQTSTDGSTITVVSTTSTNSRGISIINGQLYFTTGAGSQGIYKVGTGKPTASGTTSTLLFTPAATDVYAFALSPDGLTIYYVTASTAPTGFVGGIYRATNNGTTWTTGTLISGATTVSYTSLLVDWSGYTFSTSGANGAKIYAGTSGSAGTISSAPDNGTSAATLTVLKTLPANSAFRALSFAPIKQTLSKGASTLASNISVGSADAVLFQLNLSADEGNSTLKKLVVAKTGTATIATSAGGGVDISTFKLIDDANGNGVYDNGETVLSIGTVSGSNITFSSITLSSYINQGSSKNLLVVGTVASGATQSNTIGLNVATTNTINSIAYTSNLTNAGGSLVTMGTGGNAPTSSTVTLVSSVSVPGAGNQSACSAGSIPNITATVGAGETVDWYAAASGGSVLTNGTGTTSFATGQTAAGVYTYYAQARNTTTNIVNSTRTAVTLTITQSQDVSILIDADDVSITAGQTVNFTSDATNPGTAPQYQWYVNGSPVGGATNSFFSPNNLTDGALVHVTIISNIACANPSTAVASDDIQITVTAAGCSGTPNQGTVVAGSSSVCSGGSVTLSLTGLGTTIGLAYQWQTSTTANGTYSDVSGQTGATYTPTNITTTLFYRCNVTCTNGNATTASGNKQITAVANVTPTISIASSANPGCSGANITFTPTIGNGGGSPTYQWFKNGSQVSTASTYSSTSFADGDQVYAILTSSVSCVTSTTAQSSTITQNINASAVQSVNIASSANPDCAGHSVTFTATPTNGGGSPAYQWYNGASPISGATSDTYSSSALTNGAQISVVMTSSLACLTTPTATSNTVTQGITANVTPSVTIASNNNPVCTSGNATFTATPTNGGSATYEWFLNNVSVGAQGGTTYTLSSVTNNDTVYVAMTSGVTCVTGDVHTVNSSNGVKETIISPVTPSVTIAASPGTTITPGTNITFTATPVNGGTPTYQWKLNGTNTVTTSSYSSSSFANNDVISLVITTSLTCINTATATSNSLTVTIVNGTPFTPGNLIVYRVGDSATNLANTGNPVFLSEFTTGGVLVQNARLTKTSTTQNSIYTNGTSTTEGELTLSVDGANIVVPGYYTNFTQSSSIQAATSASINRVVALVDRNRNIDTTTRLSDWSTGNSPRSATASGNNIWVSGGAGGVRYAAKGSTTSTQLSTSVSNTRNISIFNGQLYVTSQSGAFRTAAVGTGTPTSGTANVITNLPGLPTATGSPYGMYFADLNPSVAGVDVLYIADDGTPGTIFKYSLVGGTWTANGSITAGLIRGLTGSVSGSTVTLYGTTGGSSTGAGGTAATKVYTLTDASGYNATITGTLSTLVDRSTASFIAYRGICFAPTSISTHPSDVTICSNTQPTFTVAMVTGSSASIYTYQWQSFPSGGTWSNVSNGAVYSGATTATLTVTDPTGLNGTQYRCIVTYMSNTVFTSNAATMTVTDYTVPSLSIAADQNNVCANIGVTITATPTNAGTTPNYNFKVNGVSKQNGPGSTYQSFTFANNDVVTCVMTRSGACADNTNSTSPVTMIIKSTPAVPLITGGVIQNCNIGTSTSMYADGWTGTWSSSNTSVATVSAGPTGANSTNVNAVGNGSTTISFTLSNSGSGCASVASTPYTVAAVIVNSIVCNSSACVSGATFNATNSTDITGLTAVWATENNRVSISNTGVVTPGTSPGSGLISYTVTNAASGCSTKVTKAITINALPAIPGVNVTPAIGNSNAICTGKTYQFTGTPTGGTWSTTAVPGVATLSAGGQLVTVGAGTATLTYTSPVIGGCTNKRSFTGTIVSCFARELNQPVSLNQITLSPNPVKANSTITITAKGALQNGQIVISDIYGHQILAKKIMNENDLKLGIGTLSKGMYLVTVTTANSKKVERLIVE